MAKNSKFSLRQKNNSKRSGIVLIEFCIAFFFIFLPLCMALLQYGMTIQATLAMNNTSREAGRYASINSLNATNDTALYTYIKTNASGMGIKVADADINVSPAPNAANQAPTRVRYQPITITVSYDLSERSFLQQPFTNMYHIPIFRSKYGTKVVMVMQ